MRFLVVSLALFFSPAALASVDAKCEGLVKPADYDEQAQQDFLSNYVALATTFSALHGPIPDEPGHGSLGLELSIIPPLGCDRRMVLNFTKTEDTNKTPVVPRPRVTFTFPAVGPVHLYAGLAYVPPVPILGTRNVIVSTEFGFGLPLESFQVGLRFHGTLQKTIGDVATAFDEADPAFDDLYLASTLGLEAMAGYALGGWTPYMALGFTDVSTFFFIGGFFLAALAFTPSIVGRFCWSFAVAFWKVLQWPTFAHLAFQRIRQTHLRFKCFAIIRGFCRSGRSVGH
jgi:hypothetical protein